MFYADVMMILHRDDHRDRRHTGTGSPALQLRTLSRLHAHRAEQIEPGRDQGSAQQPGAHLDTQYSISMNLWTRMIDIQFKCFPWPISPFIIGVDKLLICCDINQPSTIFTFHISPRDPPSIYCSGLLSCLVVPPKSSGTAPASPGAGITQHVSTSLAGHPVSTGQVPVEGLGAAGCMLQ